MGSERRKAGTWQASVADGIINPPIDELLGSASKYRLVIMAAKPHGRNAY
jgi:hypothetical protein